MKELHSHSASPRQLDSIINQNQIIQLPARPPIPLSVCPPVRSSVDPSDYLEKEQQQQEECAFSFSLKLNISRPQLGLTPSQQSPYPFPVPFRSHSRSRSCACSFFISCTCCPLGLVAPSNGSTSGQTAHQIYIRTINFNFWSTSNSVWHSGFGLHRDVSIHTYPPLGATKQSYPAYIKL